MSEVAHLDDLDGRSRLYLRRHFDITSFGIGVYAPLREDPRFEELLR